MHILEWMAVSSTNARVTMGMAALVAAAGCGSAGSDGRAGGAGAGGSSSGIITTGGAGTVGGTIGASVDGGLPTDFTKTEMGGYKLGDPLTSANVDAGGVNAGGGACGTTLVGVVRDFKE